MSVLLSTDLAGGFLGLDDTVTICDTDASGTDAGTGGGNKSGLPAVSTRQLQSGLPAGFDPKIWAEDPNINNGLPHLIKNPPPK